MVTDLSDRIKQHRLDPEAIQHVSKPTDNTIVVEYLARIAIGLALAQHASTLTSIATFAKAIQDAAPRGTPR
jgi:hypothetical protein